MKIDWSFWDTIEKNENKYQDKTIVIKENLFDYKTNEVTRVTMNNSFVVDLETWNNGQDTVRKPVTTITAFAMLSYLSKNSKSAKKPIASYVEDFNPIVYDIINDTNGDETDAEIKENQLFEKMLDTMIQLVKETSSSNNKSITLYMFNSSGYDNDFFIKYLVKNGYQQCFNSSFNKIIKNPDEIRPLQEQLQMLIDAGATDKVIEEQRKKIKKACKYTNEYEKHYILLGNDKIEKFSFKFVYKGYVFKIKDFRKFYQTNLKALGQTIGVSKATDIGAKYYDKDYLTLTAEEWDEYKYYAGIDIEILWKAIKKYSGFLIFDVDNIDTISSLAKHRWEELNPEFKQYFKISIADDDWDVGLASYRGGFSFVNENNLNKIHHNVNAYDINSSYPSSMRQPVAYKELKDYELSSNTLPVAELIYVEFENFELKENMLPIIPYKSSLTKNAYYKDYNKFKAEEVFKHTKKGKKKDEMFQPLKYWLWKQELEWFEKFYDNVKYTVLDRKYFACKKLFDNYLDYYYINKSQADIDKLFCSMLKDYINERNIDKIEKEMNNMFPKYFNDENTLLSKGINYDYEARKLIHSEINKINSLTDRDLESYKDDLNNQLLYLESLRTTCKLYLNSLYGKFGQDYELPSYTIIPDDYVKEDEFDLNINNITLEKQTVKVKTRKVHKILDNFIYSTNRIDKKKQYANNIYVASYITMLSRCKLYEVIHKYGADKVLYGDTDSVKIIGEIDKSYINNTELGKWKYEGTYETFAFIGSKKYIYRDTNNKFGIHIAGANVVDENKYPNWKKDKSIQDKIFKDFIAMNFIMYKQQSSIHKVTGTKIIGGLKPIVLNEKDIEKTFISINNRYKQISNLKQNQTLDYLLLDVEKEN